MKTRIAAALLALLSLVAPVMAATLLPPGQQQFLDANGKPLASGSITFYAPSSTTPKTTWQDPNQSIFNTNPVTLDAAGRATIYGSGAYRMILKDRLGNLIYDRITADTASSQISWGGTSSGTANAQTVNAPNFTATDGQIVGFVAGFTNTGQMTLTANGYANILVLKDGQSGPVNLAGGDVTQGTVVLTIYDTARGAFHIVGSGAGIGSSGFGAEQTMFSATTTDLGLASSTHAIALQGNAVMTSLGTSASTLAPFYMIRAGGAPTFRAGPNLFTPSGTDLTVAPGDIVLAVYLGSGMWRVAPLSSIGVPSNGGTTGQVAAFAMASCPNGWSAADGSARSRTAFANLYAAIGAVWGPGDGSTTFNVPDLRGQFLRGIDNGAGIDSGRTFASAQADAFRDHTHNININTASVATGAAPVGVPSSTGAPSFSTTGSPTGGGETRPRNVAILYCIKS